MKVVLRESLAMAKRYSSDPEVFTGALSAFNPLPREQYPIFRNYPERTVEYTMALKQRIADEETMRAARQKELEQLREHTQKLVL